MRFRPIHPAVFLSAAFVAACGVAAFSTNAQTTTAAPVKLGLCAACHGENGMASGKTIPNLAGQNIDYLRNALILYQSGARDVAAMRAASAMLNAAELDQILQWYAAQSPARASSP